MPETPLPWIDQEMQKLHRIWRADWAMFEPLAPFMAWLGTDSNRDLQRATYTLGHHLKLMNIPQAEYTLSLFMEDFDQAGEIRASGTSSSRIWIPLTYMGMPYAVGAILAHEITHQWLAEHHHGYPNTQENERLTDIASIANGLGKLVLNGLSEQAQPNLVSTTSYGYISSHEKYYVYRSVCQLYNLSPIQRSINLLKDVVAKLPS